MKNGSCVVEQAKEIKFVHQIIQSLIEIGINEFVVSPGGRNVPFVYALEQLSHIKKYYWPEERSSAFFGLGRIRATAKAVVIVTTSGTAAAELFPAVIEAYYSGMPLIVLTADRPKRFRGSGAPQSLEQVNLFGKYAEGTLDLELGETLSLHEWDRKRPLHLNVCLEEPKDLIWKNSFWESEVKIGKWKRAELPQPFLDLYRSFVDHSHFPFVIVGSLLEKDREAVASFLMHLGAPVYLEAPSGLREHPALAKLKLYSLENVWKESEESLYPIDGILRLGSVPTSRLWRDLEAADHQLRVCSVSHLPFSGLSEKEVIFCDLSLFSEQAKQISVRVFDFCEWKRRNSRQHLLFQLHFESEPFAEQTLFHHLSNRLPKNSLLYLGNSMPIREWDLAATYENKGLEVVVNRGCNGIDGQISTFLGASSFNQSNWAIIGDLTALYDLVAPWISAQLKGLHATLVVVNNQGASIFRKMFSIPASYNHHTLSFEELAKFWGWSYERWYSIPSVLTLHEGFRLIELIPDNEATTRFWQALKVTNES